MNRSNRDPVVVVERLSKRFGDLLAVDSVSFTVAEGSISALLGGNGAGKTTTLSMLLGVLLPSSGAVTVFGEDMVRHRHRVLGRMNFSSPYVDLPRRLTVIENLTVYGHLYGLDRVPERIREVARGLEIEPLLGRRTGNLSAGQKTRVALAKALLNEPRLLLLDEPLMGLSPAIEARLARAIKEVNRQTGITILITEQYARPILPIIDYGYVLENGGAVLKGKIGRAHG